MGYKVLARRVSSRPMDAHFWKKHKENSPNLLYVLEKHAFWTASFQCLAKSMVGYLGRLASQYPHSIIAYSVANYRPHISPFRLPKACSIDRISEQEYYRNKVKKSLVLAFIALAISRNLLHIKYFNICRV